ncbi:MAG: hypothetical protein KF774_12675 [Planctomyces sp.]|nr:hypothetical protein [Planctomyces sp.]
MLLPFRCLLLAFAGIAGLSVAAQAAPPSPPGAIEVRDAAWDAGTAVDLSLFPSADESQDAPLEYVVQMSHEQNGVFREMPATVESRSSNQVVLRVAGLTAGQEHWFRAAAVNEAGERSAWTAAGTSVSPVQQWFDGRKLGFLAILSTVCGSILAFIALARSGARLWIRRITGLDAIDEAVGRATEMGRPCLYIAGVQDLNEIETIAGITVLSRVAEKAAEYDATVVMPTSRSLVMTAARETTQAAYMTAGRPDAYQEDRIYYVTDEQFGFVAHVTGLMQREKPAACFYMGQFYAESLMLGETGNTVGAIQIAGTAQPAQLPFFVAACDYTLIGEEFFAASAYLSGDPDQLGSLKGQDVGKLVVAVLLFVGCGLLTLQNLAPSQTWAQAGADWLANSLLSSG